MTKHEIACKYRVWYLRENRVGNISSANSTRYNDSEQCQEQSETHKDDGEDVEWGFKLPEQAVLPENEDELLLVAEILLKISHECSKRDMNEVLHFLQS